MALPSLHDKTIVITGASRGLGAGLAQHYAEQGIRLGLCARSQPVLADGEGVVSRSVDVRDAAALDAFADAVRARFGSIDVWINNAGVLEPIAFVRALEPEALLDHLRINVLGVLNGSRSYLKQLDHLRQAGLGAQNDSGAQTDVGAQNDTGAHSGVLLNLSSGAALHGYAGWGSYCAGKAAVDRLSECLQLEEAERGLRVHAVAPGVIDTDMQTLIRSQSREQFPAVDKFHDLKRRDAFNSPTFVAQQLLHIAFDPDARPDSVVLRLPKEKSSS